MDLNNAEIAVTTQHLMDIKDYREYMKCRQNREGYMEDKIEVGEYGRTNYGKL